jgi:hypothetical protein
MSEKGIVSGYPDGAFKPSGTVTYGEFIKMAYIAQGGEELSTEGGNWALPYYEAAADAGLFARHEVPSAKLSEPIPREYMALMLSNALGDVEIPDYDAVIEKLADVERNAPHVYDIVKAAALGLITGYPDGTFRPEGTLTRAEAATVVYRLIDERARVLPDLRPPEEKTPLERLSDLPVPEDPRGYSPLYEITMTSGSKKPISEVIDDTIMLGREDFAGYRPALYYEIFEDYPHQMKITHDLAGRECVTIGYQGVVGYLIKDRKVIAKISYGGSDTKVYTVNMDGYEEDGYKYAKNNYGKAWTSFPDFDYIAVTAEYFSDVLLLIPNNMK